MPSFFNWASPFPNLGVSGVLFQFYFIFERHTCMQTVETLIRRRALFWICTVCICSKYGTQGLYGLIITHRRSRVRKVKTPMNFLYQVVISGQILITPYTELVRGSLINSWNLVSPVFICDFTYIYTKVYISLKFHPSFKYKWIMISLIMPYYRVIFLTNNHIFACGNWLKLSNNLESLMSSKIVPGPAKSISFRQFKEGIWTSSWDYLLIT